MLIMVINYHINDLPDNVVLHGDLAVDTEAMGLKLIRDRLCVVQICDEKGSVHLVHFPRNIYDYSAPNLKKYLTDSSRQKIFHYARFDITILKFYLGITEIPNVYCTKISSRLCRTYSDSHGLRTIVGELLKIDLKKDQQCSNWGADTLTEDQKKYAANDVLHLHALRNILNQELTKVGRLKMATKYHDFLNTVCDSDAAGFEEDLFRHN